MSQTDSFLAKQQLKYTHEVPARLCKPDIGCISYLASMTIWYHFINPQVKVLNVRPTKAFLASLVENLISKKGKNAIVRNMQHDFLNHRAIDELRKTRRKHHNSCPPW